MKKTFSLIPALFLLLSASVFSQAPDKISYQAIIRNSSNQLVTNQQVGIRISIQRFLGKPPYQDVYVETQTSTTNENGLVSLQIGSGTVVNGVFADIDWSTGTFYIKTEIDPNGGTNYTITGTTQLLSVPYALNAKNVKKYKVGDFAQGGIVFWVDETGQHGLVCSKEDLDGGNGIQWYNGSLVYTEARGDGIYAGEMNTMLIIAKQGYNSNDYAAGICANYKVVQNEVAYGDWYLPSYDELRLMYENITTINSVATLNGGTAFSDDYYWSSKEINLSQAFVISFQSGVGGTNSKSTKYRVRAVRAF